MNNAYVKILIVLVFAMLFNACKDFQDEQFKITAQEKQAIGVLQDSTGREVTAVEASAYNTDWNDKNIASHVPALYDSLKSYENIVTVSDSGYVLHVPSATDTSYLAVKSSNASGIIIYAADYIRARLLNKDNSVVAPSTTDISPETIAESINLVGSSTIIYQLKSRISIGTNQNEFVLQIIKPEQKNTPASLKVTQFRMAVFNK